MHVLVDHIVIVVPDLKNAAQRMSREFGLTIVDGGRHHGAGTQNMLVPLDGCYLELVTVVDPAEASNNLFGRMVGQALGLNPQFPNRRASLSAWSVPRPTGIPGLDIQHLSRAGMSVDLSGLAAATANPAVPFFVDRTPDWPEIMQGDGRVVSLLLAQPDDEPPWPPLTPGRTAVTYSRSSAVRGALCRVTIEFEDRTVVLDEASLAADNSP